MNFKNLLSSFFFYFAIVLFVIGFSFTDNPVGNWYQQFMPNIGGRTIMDVPFLDSLTGYAVTNNLSQTDTGFVLKTTNGGNNWSLNFFANRDFFRIKFINNDTGFICCGSGSGTPYIYKTTNAGSSWFVLSTFGCSLWRDMAVLSNDTMWVVDDDGLCGGVFRTTNGGGSWQTQATFNPNPDHIYMFNGRIGFIAKNGTGGYVRKTVDSGANWSVVVSNEGFTDMYFSDSLTGWRSYNAMRKTTNGGLNWVTQTMPSGGYIINNGVTRFSNLGRDTIWGVGSYVLFPNVQARGMIFRTTNGGDNWLFQVPDTAIHISIYNFVKFINANTGWAYGGSTGVHTTNGGDSIFYTSIKQISSEVPKQFHLFQNYPNPFNSKTIINYQLSITSHVKLKIYDMLGKEIETLVDKKENIGTYQVDWDADNHPSGVYFYQLSIINEQLSIEFRDTKKMVLIK